MREGDHYVVNGQKTWTTLAQYADWIFCLVRTDPAAKKQEGISFLLIDMKTPGITVRPIQTIDGGHEVNEVFFDDVKVPVENLVGEENKGWDCAKFLLGNERTGIARVGVSKAARAAPQGAGRARARGDKPLIEDERFREKIAAIEVELKALEMTQLRVLSRRTGSARTTAEPVLRSSRSRARRSSRRRRELLLEVVGPLRAARPGRRTTSTEFGSNEPPIGPDWAAPAAPRYFNYRKISIYGGSNEIQKNIIAKAVLGF